MRHPFLLVFLVACLGGCSPLTAIPKVEESQVAKLKSENNGIVLLHTAFEGTTATHVMITLARPNGSGHYTGIRGWQLKLPQDSAQLPAHLTLPAGQYAIVELKVLDEINVYARSARGREYTSRIVGVEGLMKVYERAMATFTVGAGEVVDIGSIQVFDGPVEANLFGKKGSFSVKITPMPAPLLKNLAEHNPQLAKARMVRTMVAPRGDR
jgi:hypothetical protein